MQPTEIVDILHRAMVVLMVTAGPVVLVSALVGLVVAVVQAATQIQDQSISQALKLGAVILVLFVGGGSMAAEVMRFSDRLLTDIATLVK